MKASDRLLKLDSHHLDVSMAADKIRVQYQDADVLEPPMRVSTFGRGDSFEEACEDYLNKISGKTLVFGYGETRKEVTVL